MPDEKTPEGDPVGDVRLLVSDVDPDNKVLEDAEYQRLLDLEHGSVHAAAGQALLVIAGSETLRLKYVQTRGLTIDGPSVGRELRMQAGVLFDRAAVHDVDSDDAFHLVDGPRTAGWF